MCGVSVGAIHAIVFAWTKFEVDITLGTLSGLALLLTVILSIPLFNRWRRGEKRDVIDQQLLVIVIVLGIIALISVVAYFFVRRAAG